MKVLFLTLLDFCTIEESGIYTDLMRMFVNCGHSLYIVSPSESKKNEPTRLIKNGVTEILKPRIGNIQKTNILEKGISTLTLESKVTSSIKKYFNAVKFDLVIYSTPPITLYKAVEYIKRRDNAMTYLLLKDIFPQNAVDMGMLNTMGVKGFIYRYFRYKEIQLYKISDYIGCMSQANVDYILSHNLFLSADKVEVCPNSIEPVSITTNDLDKIGIRGKYGIPLDKVIYIYGGNLGKPQGIDFLLECISLNESNDNSFFLIVGSGTEYNRIEKFFEQKRISNSMLLSQLPKKDYEVLANTCDVGLIFLDKHFTIPNFPSRILSYMQASMPVIAATDLSTDMGQIIEEGAFGAWCNSGDTKAFSDLISMMNSKKLRAELGKNSRLYLEKNFTSKHSYDIIIKHLQQ